MRLMQGDLKEKQDKAEAAKKELADLMVQAQAAAKKEEEGASEAQAKADDLQQEVGCCRLCFGSLLWAQLTLAVVRCCLSVLWTQLTLGEGVRSSSRVWGGGIARCVHHM